MKDGLGKGLTEGQKMEGRTEGQTDETDGEGGTYGRKEGMTTNPVLALATILHAKHTALIKCSIVLTSSMLNNLRYFWHLLLLEYNRKVTRFSRID